MYLLKRCPLVKSLGKLVEKGYSFFWGPEDMPCLIPPGTPYQFTVDADSCHHATRVDGGVPVFSDHVKVTKGLAAKNEVGGSAPSAAGVPPLAAPVAGEEAEGDPEGSGLESGPTLLTRSISLLICPSLGSARYASKPSFRLGPTGG